MLKYGLHYAHILSTSTTLNHYLGFWDERILGWCCDYALWVMLATVVGPSGPMRSGRMLLKLLECIIAIVSALGTIMWII